LPAGPADVPVTVRFGRRLALEINLRGVVDHRFDFGLRAGQKIHLAEDHA
jgi:hypothetical protein